ncbi:MAG: hypothetical protein ACREIF_09470 [Chthoniobacterales bacterium]
MKKSAEIIVVLLCLLFWSVALPVVGLMEFGALIADHLQGRAAHELRSAAR